MAEFVDENLRGARFHMVDLSGATFRAVFLRDVVMRGVELDNVDIHGEIGRVVVNGVEIGPLVEAELDRRYPLRPKMRPGDPDGFRQAWDVVEELWAGTVARARRLPPERLHESVGGEWSFIQTLRHLVFATDCWVRRAILGDPAPWHALGLPWDEAPPMDGVPNDRSARPPLDEVLALRRDRMATVRALVDGITAEGLDRRVDPIHAPGWPPPEPFPVRECLRVVLNEEWEHRLYAERDLDALERS
jgi:hypothetical protein